MSMLKKFFVNGGLFILLIVALGVVVWRSIDLESLMQTLVSTDIKYIFLGIGMMCVFFLCEAVNLGRTYRLLGSPKRLIDNIKYVCVGFFFSGITPSSTGGQPMQVVYMLGDGNTTAKSCLSLMLSFICYQTAIVCYGIVGYIVYGRELFDDSLGLHLLFIGGFLVNVAILGFMLLAVFKKNVILFVGRLIKLCIAVFSKPKAIAFKRSFSVLVDEYSSGAIYILNNTRQVVTTLMIAFIQPLAMGSVTCAVYLAMGMSGTSLLKIFFTQCIVLLSVSALPLPGSVGASESVFYRLFSDVFTMERLPSAMLLSRSISFYLFIVITGIVTAVGYVSMKRRRLERNRAAEQTCKED